MSGVDTFLALRNYYKGKINANELYVDPAIKDVREDRNNRGQTKLEIEFKGNELEEKLNLTGDDMWFYRAINSPYHEYEFYDYYSIRDDFSDGRGPWYYFDEDNMKLLKKISQYILGHESNFDSDEERSEFVKKFKSLFEQELNDIINEFHSEKNSEMTSVAQRKIDEDIQKAFEVFDFKIKNFETIYISVAELVKYYIQYNAIHMTLDDLFNLILKEAEIDGNWNENQYEYEDDKEFDSKSFNARVEYILGKIIDKYEDEMGEQSIKDFVQMVQKITKKFKPKTWYDLPKSSNYSFYIEGFDKDDNKIHVWLKKKGQHQKRIFRLSEENFYYLLYQPTLFDLDNI